MTAKESDEPNRSAALGIAVAARLERQRGSTWGDFKRLADVAWIRAHDDGSSPECPRADGSYGYPQFATTAEDTTEGHAMTDRERLLEQVREAEERADSVWKWILRPQYRHSVEEVADIAARHARESAHHALTALALRDVIDVRGAQRCGDPKCPIVRVDYAYLCGCHSVITVPR